MGHSRHIYKCMALLLVTVATGCAATAERRVIGVGDRVRVGYSCRLPNGELAATTEKDAGDPSVPKSALFMARKGAIPLSLAAGVAPAAIPGGPGFDDDIAAGLAQALPGMSVGEKKRVELKGEPVPGLAGNERFLRMARVRKRPKEMRLSREEYAAKTGREPEVGRRFVLDPAFPGQVTEVSAQEAVISFPFPEGGEIRTPFGSGKVRDAGDRYEIEIDARAGRLVRSGPVVGRISEVNDRDFTIDYGYRFGGETLSCEVQVEAVEPAGEARKSSAVLK